jgi:hypothetical protein
MDPAILSVASALAGSLIGGASTLTSSWFTHRVPLRAQVLVQEAVKRETLYAEFIIEASKRFTEAWGHEAKSPEVVAGLYSAIERMRLTSSAEVIRVAEQVIRRLIRDYAAPEKTFDEFQEEFVGSEDLDIRDPLREFGEVCRVELRALRA